MNENDFDVIVVGSGIGGLGAAAALATRGRRVLVLEQHSKIGGLTQAFTRRGYPFSSGVHYVGGAGDVPGAEGRFGHLLGILTDGKLQFAPIESPYDIVRLPDLEFRIQAPEEAYIADLKTRFPAQNASIDRYFSACHKAADAGRAMFAAKALPPPVAAAIRLLKHRQVRHAFDTTAADSVQGIADSNLRAVLNARWGLCGMPPDRAPFAAHALTTTSLFHGAYYPVGGPERISETLAQTIENQGGELRTRAEVIRIRTQDGRTVGVELSDGETLDAPIVISAMGAHNTLAALPEDTAPRWRSAVARLTPSTSCICLYLGFRGDIREHGATSSSHWIYETENIGDTWDDPSRGSAPSLFVSFPTLKDPAYASARHVAEVLIPCPWEPFSQWASSPVAPRPDAYCQLKASIEERVLAQFKTHFPGLVPLIDFREISTPLSQMSFVRAHKGAMYGLDMSLERVLSSKLRVRTPLPGLLMAGQDAAGPGLQAAFIGGFMAAASVDSALWKELRG